MPPWPWAYESEAGREGVTHWLNKGHWSPSVQALSYPVLQLPIKDPVLLSVGVTSLHEISAHSWASVSLAVKWKRRNTTLFSNAPQVKPDLDQSLEGWGFSFFSTFCSSP